MKIQLHAGNTVYLFSDGYAGQFGGGKNKKFSYKQFKDLLFSVQDKSMEKQKQVLDNTIEKWRG
ncbi:MAG: hypothetical protein COX07_05715 [Bacteroidetes bacterium CG23_combo_of_CG06-09_8_20_14_all_32_9]|nr:MAG: hypothetical protein COX07_05715 [Bacteroidetes bacterium CG23_combo_of_CG06-09_8_20_14_all_32_9]